MNKCLIRVLCFLAIYPISIYGLGEEYLPNCLAGDLESFVVESDSVRFTFQVAPRCARMSESSNKDASNREVLMLSLCLPELLECKNSAPQFFEASIYYMRKLELFYGSGDNLKKHSDLIKEVDGFEVYETKGRGLNKGRWVRSYHSLFTDDFYVLCRALHADCVVRGVYKEKSLAYVLRSESMDFKDWHSIHRGMIDFINSSID